LSRRGASAGGGRLYARAATDAFFQQRHTCATRKCKTEPNP
jgi:hypothetical protein